MESQHYRLHKEFGEVNAALHAQRRANAAQELVLREREEVMKKKDIELQSQILRFSQFLEQNEAKRARAARRVLEEEAAERTAIHRSRQLAAEVEGAKAAVTALQAELDKIQRYQEYLLSVAEASSGAFSTPDSVMDRYRVLETACTSLLHAERNTMQGTQAAHSSAAAAASAAQARAQELRFRLAQVHASCHEAARKAKALQSSIDAAQATHTSVHMEEWKAHAATSDMYHRVLSRTRLGQASGEQSSAAQLTVIAQFVADMQTALREASPAP